MIYAHQKITQSFKRDLVDNKNTFSLLGLGKHAERAIIPAFKSSELARLSLIGTNKVGLPQAISYQQAIESEHVDNVFISLPNSLHAQWTISALNCAKNVICEKPLCCSFEDAKKILAAQNNSKTKLLEAFMYRYHPQHQIVKKILAEGIIGKPRLFEAHFHYYLDDYKNIRMNKELGGGALYDVGCYLIDSCLFLFEDKAKEISGSWIIDQEAKVDEFSVATIKFDSGLVAHLTCGSRLTRQSSYSIYGELGKITVRDAFKIPKNKKGLVLLEKINGEKQEIFSQPADHYQLMIDAFCTTQLDDTENILNRAWMIEAWRDSCLCS